MDNFDRRSASQQIMDMAFYKECLSKALDTYDKKMKTGDTNNPHSIALAVEGYRAIQLMQKLIETPASWKDEKINGESNTSRKKATPARIARSKVKW